MPSAQKVYRVALWIFDVFCRLMESRIEELRDKASKLESEKVKLSSQVQGAHETFLCDSHLTLYVVGVQQGEGRDVERSHGIANEGA